MATGLISCPCSRLAPRAAFPSRTLQKTGAIQRVPPANFRGTVLFRSPVGRGVRVKNATVCVSATATAMEVKLQDFLEEAQAFGKVHVYVNSHGQYKTRTTIEYIFYNDSNDEARLVHKDGASEQNFPIRRVSAASFKRAQELGVPLYIVQFTDKTGLISFSLTLMADPKTREYEPEQVDAYNALMEKYGPEVKFSNKV